MKKPAEIPGKPEDHKKIFYAIFAAIIALILLIIFSGGITALLLAPDTPKETVTNQTLVNDDDLLFNYEINRYPARVQISDPGGENITLGFELDPGSINFGIVPRGGNMGKRFITLENTADEPSRISLAAYGNISDMVKFSDNDFLLEKGVPKPLEIVLETKNTTELGNYSGEIDIIVKKPKYSISSKLL